VGENLYKTVESLKTNNDGEAIGNLIQYTTWYKFIIEYNGVSYLVTEPTKIFETTKVFRIDLTGDDWFANYDVASQIGTTLNFTNSTKNFRFTWNDPSGAMHYGCLKVTQFNRTTEKVICDSCTQSTAATILCNIGTNVEGNTYKAQGYFKFDDLYMDKLMEIIFPGQKWIPLYQKGNDAKLLGVFVSFMLILTCVFVAVWSTVAAVVMLLVEFFIVTTLGLLAMKVSMFMTLTVLGLILIFKLGRNK